MADNIRDLMKQIFPWLICHLFHLRKHKIVRETMYERMFSGSAYYSIDHRCTKCGRTWHSEETQGQHNERIHAQLRKKHG